MITENIGPISIRPPAVAGLFYPEEAAQLNNMLDKYLERIDISDAQPPKAIIAPHAGYIYSGLVAASIYATIAKLRTTIKRVVLLGPAHRVYVDGIALPSNTHFSTPLGNVPIDQSTIEIINTYPFSQYMDSAHTQEHSLEVHIPFLQKILDDFVLIPILIGRALPEQIATILEQLWGKKETLIIISSDLSHYLDYDTACKIDSNTTHLIETFDYRNIKSEQACGYMPIQGLLKFAEQKHMQVKTLDLKNSGDTAGTKDRVVGYGAYALIEEKQPQNKILNNIDKILVFDVIKKSIKQGLKGESFYRPNTDSFPPLLQKTYAVFVTLKLNNQLRGCIGTIEARESLVQAAARYAHAAAFSDPRFKPLTQNEYQQLEISLSILTPTKEFSFTDEQDLMKQLYPGTDGLIIERHNKRATFLPIVWQSIPEPKQFLYELKRKAGIKTSDMPLKAWRYQAEYYLCSS